jgi:hypothetical protein
LGYSWDKHHKFGVARKNKHHKFGVAHGTSNVSLGWYTRELSHVQKEKEKVEKETKIIQKNIQKQVSSKKFQQKERAKEQTCDRKRPQKSKIWSDI